MTYRLYDFGPSPFCIKIRALLDYKRQRYERIDVNGPRFLVLRRKNPTGKVPALEIDGELVADSTDIAYALEARHPEPSVLPEHPRDRALCHVLEDWADEALYFYGLYHRWQDERGIETASKVFPLPLRPFLTPAIGGGARRQLRGQGVGRKSACQVADDLRRHLAACEALLDGQPWLLGERPMLCDFAVASQLLYLSRTPTGAERLDAFSSLAGYLERFRDLRAR